MTAIVVPISEEQLEKLRQQSRRLGIAPEELAKVGLEEWLRQSRSDFAEAAQYVLAKNAELYRRLA